VAGFSAPVDLRAKARHRSSEPVNVGALMGSESWPWTRLWRVMKGAQFLELRARHVMGRDGEMCVERHNHQIPRRSAC
jgi:hypothetical protein